MDRLKAHRLEIETISPELSPVLEYWRGSHKEGEIGPTWDDFELLDLPSELLPSTLVVDVLEGPRDLRYRYFGSKIAEVFGSDYSSQTMGELPAFFTSHSKRSYGWVIDEQTPVLLILEYVREIASTRLMEILRVPLSNNGKSVTCVVSVARLFADRRELSRLMEDAG